jgi:hypothetical protein
LAGFIAICKKDESISQRGGFERGSTMNWQTVFQSVQSIAKGTRDAPRAMVALRQEVVASTQLTAAEKEEMHRVLDSLRSANMYGQIALVGQLKEVLATHAEWKAQYPEDGARRER